MNTNKAHTILSPQQEAVLRQILPIARIATSGAVANLPVRPRAHTLLIGPSGSGKSFMARELGRMLGLPVQLINVSSWVVLSAKNEPWTASTICEWLDSLGNSGGILALDEIDKLQGDTDWKSYIRLEVHDLLDGVIPNAARMPAQPNDEPWEGPSSQEVDRLTRTMLSARLMNKVFVIGCGAWQPAWSNISRRIGFERESPDSEHPSRQQILESISPEIRQRFRDEVCWFDPMKSVDYRKISERIAEALPHPGMGRSWNRLAKPAIERALAGDLGMRIFEEIMLSVLLDESSGIAVPYIGEHSTPNL